MPIEFDEQGNVLDGHHRLQICTELGIKDFPKVIRVGMTEEEKRTHARKLNMARRQLNREQKQELIRDQLRETPEKSDRQIARELGIDKNTVNARRLEMESGGEIHHLNMTIGSDGKQYPRQVERKPVAIFNPTRREERAIKNPEVIERMANTGANVLAAEKHYLTMPLDEICKLPIPAEDNAVLFIWVTSPMLEDSFKVINAWGFKYKTSFVWDKVAHNMGHYNSVRHEFLLICTRGSCTPDVAKLFDSVVSIERTEHSRKPKEFRDMIDTLYPIGNRLEMFAREAPEGWDVWGNMA